MRRFHPPMIIPSILLLISSVCAEDWPQWRGPRADGTSTATTLPMEWGVEKNILWKSEIPGEGHSSPIIFGNRVFLTTATGDGHDRNLVCLDAETGALLWNKLAVRSEDLESLHQQNNYASSTPATDGELVFTSFYANKRMHVVAFDYAGNIKWQADPLAYDGEHGYNHSPTLHGGLVIFDVTQLKEPAILAFEAKSGKLRWKIETEIDSCSNVPPVVLDIGSRKQLITCGNNSTRAIEPMTGKVIWNIEGPTDYCVAGLTLGDEILLATGGYPKRQAIAIRVGEFSGEGSPSIAWTLTKASTYVPSPVFHAGHFFMINDNGITSCISAASGETVWQQRIPGDYRASLILVADKIYATNDEGTTTIFEAVATGYKQLAENRLDDFFYATPSLAHERIYMRAGGHLYCIGTK